MIDPAVKTEKFPVEALIVETDILLELMTETDKGLVTRPVFVIVVIPATVERLMPAPAAKFALMLPVMVEADSVLQFITLTDKGDDTPVIVLVMVVIPKTVERLMPTPARKFSDRFPLTVTPTSLSVVMTLVFVW